MLFFPALHPGIHFFQVHKPHLNLKVLLQRYGFSSASGVSSSLFPLFLAPFNVNLSAYFYRILLIMKIHDIHNHESSLLSTTSYSTLFNPLSSVDKSKIDRYFGTCSSVSALSECERMHSRFLESKFSRQFVCNEWETQSRKSK